jgi:uncharacterized protein YqjF (DUF2071 family)
VSADGPRAELDCSFAPSGERYAAVPGTLDSYLTERYCLYTLADGGTVHRGEIHHPPWPLRPADVRVDVNTMAAEYGLALDGEPVAHYAELQDVLLWTIAPTASAAHSPE